MRILKVNEKVSTMHGTVADQITTYQSKLVGETKRTLVLRLQSIGGRPSAHLIWSPSRSRRSWRIGFSGTVTFFTSFSFDLRGDPDSI
jgi:hypothetical protein